MSEFTIDAITPAIGAFITGIDLNQPINEAQQGALYDALVKHHVIFLRDQDLSPEAHLRLAQGFGTLDGKHPVYPHLEGFENIVVLKNDPDNLPDTDGWHTDLTFKADPPFASILRAKHVPPCGGDTLWTSLCSAYDRLPAGIKAEVENLRAVHDLGDFRNDFSVDEANGEALTAAHQRFGSTIHDVVKTHPVSGRRFLYVNEGFTQHIVGLRATDSNQLLQFLFHHINQPENQVRLHWQTHTLAIWDNRCTWHYATNDYLPHTREMHRITVLNDPHAD